MDTPAMTLHRRVYHASEGSHLILNADGSWSCATCANKARAEALKLAIEAGTLVLEGLPFEQVTP